jgi:4-aminobutyrate aminotransferase-like enzyme
MEVIEHEADPAHSARLGKMLRTGLEKLQEKYPIIGDVRGKGLMQGLELVKDRQSKEPHTEGIKQLFEATRELGLLIGKGGLYGNVVRISPPLTAQEEDVAKALDILDRAFARVR